MEGEASRDMHATNVILDGGATEELPIASRSERVELQRLESTDSIGEELDVPGAFPDAAVNANEKRNRRRLRIGVGGGMPSTTLLSDLPTSANHVLPHTPSMHPQTPLAASLSSNSNVFDSSERLPSSTIRVPVRNPYRKRSDSAPLPSATVSPVTANSTSSPFGFNTSAGLAQDSEDARSEASRGPLTEDPLEEEGDEEEEFLVDEDVLEDDEYADDDFDDPAVGSRRLRLPGMNLSSLAGTMMVDASDGELAIGREEEDMLESYSRGNRMNPNPGIDTLEEEEDGKSAQEQDVGILGVNGEAADELHASTREGGGLGKPLRRSLPPLGIPLSPPTSFAPIAVPKQRDLTTAMQPSALSLLFTSHSASPSPPPFQPYSRVLAEATAATGPSLSLSLYFPHSKSPSKPIKCKVLKSATVEEVVGVGLYLFEDDDSREPKLEVGYGEGEVSEKDWGVRMSTVGWSLRIVEDDGEVDEDFPGESLIYLFLRCSLCFALYHGQTC